MKDNYDFSKGTRGKWYRKDVIMRLPEAIADVKREACASVDIDAELEAWRNEDQANLSKIP
jgi:hypothetical protein